MTGAEAAKLCLTAFVVETTLAMDISRNPVLKFIKRQTNVTEELPGHDFCV